MWENPHTVSMCPVALEGRAGFDLNTGHIFPESMLVAITLVGGVVGDKGPRARARCDLGLRLCLVAVTSL